MTCCPKSFRLALWGVVAAVASLASPGSVSASEKGTLTVKDNGSVFTADGVRKAEDAFESVTFQAPTKLAVVTFGKIPDAKRAAFEDAKPGDARKRFFRDWAEEVARSSGKPDVLVFISMEGSHVRAIDDRQADTKRGFNDNDLRTLEQKFVAGFKPVAGEDSAAKLARHDAALVEGATFVANELKNTTVPANTKRANGGGNNAAESKGTGIMGYICIGIVVLLGIWLVFGLVRMMMGGGGGGGYGGGGGGYGGGGMGGGGGLMTGLLGGMLGAVAGNYLYNNFMGGNSHSNDVGSGGGYGDSGTSGDTGAGDYSGGGDGGGSDFSGDAGGGSSGSDFGGGDSGGGDFGGGSDFGGGGDSGGGDW